MASIDSPLNKYFLKVENLNSRTVYDFYRSQRKKVAKEIDQYNYFVKAVEGLFLTLQSMMIQSTGGVYIKGLGYFCAVKTDVPVKKGGIQRSLLLSAKKEYKYFPYFFPDREFSEWTMSSTFDAQLKVKMNNSGRKYQLHFDLCESSRFVEAMSKRIQDFRGDLEDLKFIPKI